MNIFHQLGLFPSTLGGFILLLEGINQEHSKKAMDDGSSLLLSIKQQMCLAGYSENDLLNWISKKEDKKKTPREYYCNRREVENERVQASEVTRNIEQHFFAAAAEEKLRHT
ncbi:unnamed protein product [Notodromas monacha]|uniref:Uncharacterized protein n=1 Tax=Notodromas monacha TaxID=399045 RepID=A0A7R9BKB0_9CRUS|nr:unnamed protein product [Notodromas monacha]CAG0916278.1 unnamed protein product [Notodromas monacha]